MRQTKIADHAGYIYRPRVKFTGTLYNRGPLKLNNNKVSLAIEVHKCIPNIGVPLLYMVTVFPPGSDYK